MRIYANGCSFTYGDELTDPKNDAWPAVLAKKSSSSLVNDSERGGSNQRTLYRTIKNLANDFDFYIIAWTADTRFTQYKSDNNFETNFNPSLEHSLYGDQWFYKKWGETYYKFWHNKLFAFKLWLQQIIQLQSLLKHKRYLMINTFSNNLAAWTSEGSAFVENTKSLINFDIMNDVQIIQEYKEIQFYIDTIDKSKFYKWNEFAITDLRRDHKCGPRGHFLESGHLHLSNLIFDHINIC